ncbi:MAG: hypothetical protein R3F30_10070 [Planctomycetota bacterium]
MSGTSSPGESLRFEFLSGPSGGALAFIVGALAVLAGIILIYRRDARRLGLGRRMTLATLRVLALVSVFLVLLEPNLTKVRKVTRPGEVLMLVDSSQSMGHLDSYARSTELAEAWKALGVDEPSKVTRMDLAKVLLARKGLTDGLAAKNRLRGYHFGPGVRPLAEKERPAPAGAAPRPAPEDDGALPPPPIYDWDQLEPTDGVTNLTASVRQALEGSRDARIAGMVLVTDGRRNMGGSLEELGPLLKRRKVDPVWVVPVGDPAEAWILEVLEVQAAERSFKGDPVKVSALIGSQGYGPISVNVSLLRKGPKDTEPRLVQNIVLDVGGDRLQAVAEFAELKLEEEGEHELIVKVDPPAGEDFDAERHQATHKLTVLSEKMRVLLIAGAPTPEFRILRNQLIRDPTIDASTWLLSADKDFPQDGNTVITSLPAEPAELEAYAVVVLLDPDPDNPQLAGGFAQMLAKAVTERGMGLWWIMGEKFSGRSVLPGSTLEPLVSILPVVPDVQLAEKTIGFGYSLKAEFPYSLTTEGKEHRVTRLAQDRTINETYWSKLPGHRFAFPVRRAKPGATVLMRHAADERRGEDGNWPILALQFVGAGRVLYTGTDETYLWRGVAEQAYDSFWVKGLRYLYEGKLAGGSDRFKLGLSAESVTLGDEIEIYLRALDERYEPMAVASLPVTITAPGGRQSIVDLKPTPKVPGRYTASYRPGGLGLHQVQVTAPDGGDTSVPVEFKVERSRLESQGPADLAGLQRFADAAGGRVLRPDELPGLLDDIRSMSRTETFLQHFPLWDSWLTMLFVLGFLTAEWILRKLWDLL